MGTKGYFPLFDESWVAESFQNTSPLSASERECGEQILERLIRHRGIDRKKTILWSLKDQQRSALVKLFFELVEQKMQNVSGVIQ